MRNPGHNRKKAAAAQRMRSLGVQEAFFLVCTAAKLHIHTPTTDCPGAASDFPPFRPPPSSKFVLRRTPTKPSAKHIHTHMALPWGKQPSSAVPASGELDVSIVHWGERSARNANLFSPSKLPKDGAAQC